MKKLHVIKIGGNVIDDDSALKKFIADFSSIKEHKILVHGGGKEASQIAEKLNIPQTLVNGRRITNAETLKVITMVYSGLNKYIVGLLQAKNVYAIGLSGADLNSIKARKRKVEEIDYGFVGDINDDGVNTAVIHDLIEKNITPVFCAITHDGKGQLLNTNADTIASAIGVALSKMYDVQLTYCFEKKGVLRNIEDNDSVISSINKKEYKQLLADGVISKGMIPKLDNSFNAIDKGVNSIMIAHSGDIINATKENQHAGTKLVA